MYGFLIVGSRRNSAIGPKRWQFLGLLEYLRHYPDIQTDARGAIRRVWLFEFRLHGQPEVVVVEQDYEASEHLLRTSRTANRSTEDERILADASPSDEQRDDPSEAADLEGIRCRLLAQPAEWFEHFLKDLLVATGYERVTVTRFSQDGGVDINAHAGGNMWAIENVLVQVQAKRWLHTVGRREVAELRGSLQPHACGALVTTSHYSKAAISEARASGKSPIVLVDGYSLARIVKVAGLSVA